jgi:hypothetical protein
VTAERQALTRACGYWLDYGQVCLSPSWGEQGFALSATSALDPGLCGTLALQLCVAVQAGLYRCDDSDCGLPFAPTSRQPKMGQKHYCPACQGPYVASKRQSAQTRRRKQGSG